MKTLNINGAVAWLILALAFVGCLTVAEWITLTLSSFLFP